MIGVIGLAILLAPQQLSSSTIVGNDMEADIQTRTKEISNQIKLQDEFVSVHGEFIEEDNTEYIGKFTITRYCGCQLCNGRWHKYPAKNGEPLQEGYTIAVDPDVIPLGTWVYIDGIGYRKACDTGSAIKGNKIDVYVDDHELCYELGVTKDVQVWIKDGK